MNEWYQSVNQSANQPANQITNEQTYKQMNESTQQGESHETEEDYYVRKVREGEGKEGMRRTCEIREEQARRYVGKGRRDVGKGREGKDIWD